MALYYMPQGWNDRSVPLATPHSEARISPEPNVITQYTTQTLGDVKS